MRLNGLSNPTAVSSSHWLSLRWLTNKKESHKWDHIKKIHWSIERKRAFFFFFNIATSPGRSLIYSLFMFHIIYILRYVLMVKDNNTLISSLHVNPIDGVNHLIRLRTRTISFLVSIPETPAGFSSSIRRACLITLPLPYALPRRLTSRWCFQDKKRRKDRDLIPRPLAPCR